MAIAVIGARLMCCSRREAAANAIRPASARVRLFMTPSLVLTVIRSLGGEWEAQLVLLAERVHVRVEPGRRRHRHLAHRLDVAVEKSDVGGPAMAELAEIQEVAERDTRILKRLRAGDQDDLLQVEAA